LARGCSYSGGKCKSLSEMDYSKDVCGVCPDYSKYVEQCSKGKNKNDCKARGCSYNKKKKKCKELSEEEYCVIDKCVLLNPPGWTYAQYETECKQSKSKELCVDVTGCKWKKGKCKPLEEGPDRPCEPVGAAPTPVPTSSKPAECLPYDEYVAVCLSDDLQGKSNAGLCVVADCKSKSGKICKPKLDEDRDCVPGGGDAPPEDPAPEDPSPEDENIDCSTFDGYAQQCAAATKASKDVCGPIGCKFKGGVCKPYRDDKISCSDLNEKTCDCFESCTPVYSRTGGGEDGGIFVACNGEHKIVEG